MPRERRRPVAIVRRRDPGVRRARERLGWAARDRMACSLSRGCPTPPAARLIGIPALAVLLTGAALAMPGFAPVVGPASAHPGDGRYPAPPVPRGAIPLDVAALAGGGI